MKKILFALLFALCFTPAYSYWGVGFKYGQAPVSASYIGYNTDSVSGNKDFGGIELIYTYEAEIDAISLSLGFDIYDTVTVNRYTSTSLYYYSYWHDQNDIINTSAVPFKISYQYKLLPSLFVGAGTGLTLINKGGHCKRKIFPHIDLGAEWRPFSRIGLGVDFAYNMGSSVENQLGNAKRDIDGISTSFSARVYF